MSRYSSLDQIHAGNVGTLQVLWRRPAIDPQLAQAFGERQPSKYLTATPVLINGLLYAPNAVGLVEAFDPETGATVWRQQPFTPEEAFGRSTRGVDYWSDGANQRLLVLRGEYLYALDPKTGRTFADFGEGGRVPLRRPGPNALQFGPASLVVVGDVAVVAGIRGGAGDRSIVKEREPGDIMGYDVRTGRLLWTFNFVPRPGAFGADTWGNGSSKDAGDMASWCCMSADEELGYVYVPTSSATGFYGGHRPGDNLFSNSLVTLNARTGERVWHFQMIHHGVWEYENAGAPLLGDITVDGRRIKAVIQPNKTGYLFVFDRVTGKPVWPIEERPVPQSTVPGERLSPTQPFPTKPAPLDRQGITENDLLDFTPELRAKIREFVQPYVLASSPFTPPSLVDDAPGGKKGTLQAPGSYGASNWNTGAFDPETGMYYAVTHTLPGVDALTKASTAEATIAYVRVGTSPIFGPDDLPLTKPPYGRITAIDLNRGEHVWMVPNGDGPRNHPLLKDLNLPPLGTGGRAVALVTKTLLFVGEGSDVILGSNHVGFWGTKFRAYDKATGRVVWETELPAGTTAAPMTYLFKGKQYIIVPVGGSSHPAEWVALGAPGSRPATDAPARSPR